MFAVSGCLGPSAENLSDLEVSSAETRLRSMSTVRMRIAVLGDRPRGRRSCTARIGARPALGGPTPSYDGRFTFVRLRWGSGSAARFRGMSDAWNHDFPRAEQNLMPILKDLTLIDARTDGGLILTLDDPRLFLYPIAFMWEPGFWTMTDVEAERFREYLLKGGFAIFDDFEQDSGTTSRRRCAACCPEARWVKLDQTHRDLRLVLPDEDDRLPAPDVRLSCRTTSASSRTTIPPSG